MTTEKKGDKDVASDKSESAEATDGAETETETRDKGETEKQGEAEEATASDDEPTDPPAKEPTEPERDRGPTDAKKADAKEANAKKSEPAPAPTTAAQRALRWLPRLWSNWTSLLGLTLMCIAGNSLLIVYIVDIVRGGLNAYVTALAYVGLPPVLLVGLALALLGAWRHGQRKPDVVPGQILANKHTRRRLLFVIGGTFINLTVISFFAYRGVSYMHSTSFCANACHVMKPEAVAHEFGPHLRVACPDCHIKKSTEGQVQAKLAGLRQLWGVVSNDYSKPIPTPVMHLPDGAESCGGCHPREHWRASYIRIVPHFKSDEKNSRTITVLRMNVGGLDPFHAVYKGIHFHASATTTVKYEVLDKTRSKIGKVFVTRRGKDGKEHTTTYLPPKKLAGLKVLRTRTMDCTDCHNRIGHPFARSPERAIDRLLYFTKIDPSLPFVRKQALTLLKAKLPSGTTAAKHYRSVLEGFYAKKYPKIAKDKAKQITDAAAAIARLYDHNIFPAMKVGWVTYRSQRGHPKEDSKLMFGCFRCHDDSHKTKDGKKSIGQDCDKCHEQLVEDEAKPTISPEILKIGRP